MDRKDKDLCLACITHGMKHGILHKTGGKPPQHFRIRAALQPSQLKAMMASGFDEGFQDEEEEMEPDTEQVQAMLAHKSQKRLRGKGQNLESKLKSLQAMLAKQDGDEKIEEQ